MQDEKKTCQKSSCCSLEPENFNCGEATQELEDVPKICKKTNVRKKPVVNFKKCFTDKHVCTAIKSCPVEAIRYIEVDEPILNKQLTDRTDRCPLAARGIRAKINLTEKNTGCLSTANLTKNKSGDIIDGVGNPWGRIIIDYDECIYCSKCVDACCGYAIDLLCDDPNCDCQKSSCC